MADLVFGAPTTSPPFDTNTSQAAPAGFSFGASTSQAAPAGFSFGANTSQAAPASFSFGANTSQATPAGFSFGANTSQATPASFSLGTPSTPFLFDGSTSQPTPAASAGTTNPFLFDTNTSPVRFSVARKRSVLRNAPEQAGSSASSPSQKEQVLIIKSPFPNLIHRFNDKSDASFFDVEVQIPGEEAPFSLHRLLLANASNAFLALLQCKASANGKYDPEAHTLQWVFGVEGDTTYRKVLIKWLRFCYGEDISLKPEECGASVAALCQLQLTCGNDVRDKLYEFMVNVAEIDAKEGMKLLLSCIKYVECHDDDKNSIDMKIARMLFTRANFTKDSSSVTEECLFELPSYLLDAVEYGEPHSEWSEFRLRLRYIEQHKTDMSVSEKADLMKKCDFTKLNSAEIKELRKLEVLSSEELLNALEFSMAQNEKATCGQKEQQLEEAIKQQQTLTEKEVRFNILQRELQSHLSAIMADTPSMKTEIPCYTGSNPGGAIYDAKRGIILSVNNRDISITKMTDDTHGTTTTMSNIIPFESCGHYPVYDGNEYTYFFEGSGASNRFGRFDMDSLLFLELPPLSGPSFRGTSGGCVCNGHVYIPSSEGKILEYDPKCQKWNTLDFLSGITGFLINHPNNSWIVFCQQNNAVISVNLRTKQTSSLCNNPFPLSLFPYEAYVVSTPHSGVFIFLCMNNSWQVFCSKRKEWVPLKRWKQSRGLGHFIIIPERKTAMYHVPDSTCWEMVRLPSVFL